MNQVIGTVLQKATGFFSGDSGPTPAAANRRLAARVAASNGLPQ